MSRGTSVKATEIDFPSRAETKFIKDDFCLVTDGRAYLANTQVYSNGTTILTIKTTPDE